MGIGLIKIVRTTLRTIVTPMTLMFVMACSSSVPFKQANLDGLMEDMERKAYLVRQFQVRFVKTRSVPAFNRELKVKGRLVFQKPAKMWLRLTGDVNVELLSDGRFIKIVHDNTDEETFKLRGDRDMTKFADPLMLLINSVGNGGLRDLTILKTVEGVESTMVEIDPSNESRFERIQSIFLWLSHYGEIGRVRILFTDGGTDDTVFESWSVLSDDAPEIRELKKKLRTVSTRPSRGEKRGDRGKTRRALVREDPLPEQLGQSKPLVAVDFGGPPAHVFPDVVSEANRP